MDTKQDKVKNENGENASSEEIRTDIKGTRREMDDTLDELGERLHPRHLLDEVIDIFRGSPSGSASRDQLARTSKRLGRTVANELRERPLPALLIGAGLIWWILDATTNDGDEQETYSRRGRRTIPIERGWSAEDPAFEGTAPPSYSPMVDDNNDYPSMTDAAGDMASSAGEKLSDAASAVGDKISEAASSIGETASDLGEAARRYSTRGRRVVSRKTDVLRDRFRATSDEYPLAVGGAFLAAGVLTGLLLPRTEQEDKWMGEASDELKEQTRRKGEELVEKGKEAAARYRGRSSGRSGETRHNTGQPSRKSEEGCFGGYEG